MDTPAGAYSALSDDALEEQVLTLVPEAAQRHAALVDALREWQRRRRPDKADACADLIIEALMPAGVETAFLDALSLQAGWHDHSAAFTAKCQQRMADFFERDAQALALLPHCGFQQALPAAECLRRFTVLRRLTPHAFCYDKTWGFGVVAEWDAYAQQMVIDFDRKKQHRMSWSYAAEALQVLEAEHLLARRHRDPAGFAAWLEQEPAEAVKDLLRCFGPLNVAGLQTLFVERLSSAERWKPFWEAALKSLRAGRDVEIPAKRNEPLRLAASRAATAADPLQTLAQERDFETLLRAIETLQTEPGAALTDARRAAIVERLEFIIRGARVKQVGAKVRALLLAEPYLAGGVPWDHTACLTEFLSPAPLIEALEALPARCVGRFIRALDRAQAAVLRPLLVRCLPDLILSLLNEALEFLQDCGEETALRARLLELTAGKPGADLLCWLIRHPEAGLCPLDRLAVLALNALESGAFSGKRLKARHQLVAVFETSDWLRDALGVMREEQRRDFALRLKRSPLWQGTERQALLKRLSDLFPEMAVETPTPEAAAKPARLTSRRSYLERQAQLTKLITVDIPRNSHDIGVARGYGDLRENFEYKAAREMQGILMRRRTELEIQLSEVRSAEFDGLPADVAGLATRVTLRYDDGRAEQYCILGEWDNDATLGIISSRSKLALALMGQKPGSRVRIPAEHGMTDCILAAVEPLPDAVRAWIRAEPPPPA